jgi:hypothetical protein
LSSKFSARPITSSRRRRRSSGSFMGSTCPWCEGWCRQAGRLSSCNGWSFRKRQPPCRRSRMTPGRDRRGGTELDRAVSATGDHSVLRASREPLRVASEVRQLARVQVGVRQPASDLI